ncbi:MAG TPA: DUF6184 family natural product biosynthesis lipoprotein [Polyangiaceae bacterium]|jgi:hypothetical protein|nr:DUF6184 family natural product biosynthesis lipoprotein [Polyangiaceae bacterium]
MKTIIGLGGVVGCIWLIACGSAPQPTPAAGPVPMRTRINYALATPRIATAECEHELKCGNVGSSLKFSSIQHCEEVKSAGINQDFATDENCKNGILADDLDKCVSKTVDATCEGLSSVITDMERASVCGSADLCLD